MHGIIGIQFIQASQISRERALVERTAQPVPRSAPVTISRTSRRRRTAKVPRRALAV
jgi:hypothetical protein